MGFNSSPWPAALARPVIPAKGPSTVTRFPGNDEEGDARGTSTRGPKLEAYVEAGSLFRKSGKYTNFLD